MPRTIPVKKLKATHPEYRPDKLQRYQAIYEGGELFADMIDEFLIRRQVEEGKAESFNINANEIYRERKKWAQYLNRTGGLIDWFCAIVFPDVRIEAESDPDNYWADLNRDADGLGNPLPVVMRRVLRESLVHNRSYIKVHFPSDVADLSRPETMALRMRPVCASAVDDWETEEGSPYRLDWVRVKSETMTRESPIGPRDIKVCRWAYVTPDGIYVYEYKKEDGKPDTGKEKVATLVLELKPEYPTAGDKKLPIYQVCSEDSLWLMERVYDVAVGLYNAEAAVTFSMMLSAYAQLVLTLGPDSDPGSIVMSELAAVRMDAEIGEKAEYLTPPSSVFDPQFKNIERLKEAYYEVLQSMSKNAEVIPQIGRASGETIQQLREPMQALIASLGWPVVTAVERWIEDAKEFRGDTGEVKLVLPESYSVTMQDMVEAVEPAGVADDIELEENDDE